jgi:hypothetical protein
MNLIFGCDPSIIGKLDALIIPPNVLSNFSIEFIIYVVAYVDDIIVISKETIELIDMFKETCALKGIGTSEYYLGGNFHQITDPELLERGIRTVLRTTTYIKDSVY